ncbi:NADPH-dependent FMN reductase family protein [Dongshaea marina]|uniref:hypothetical protein n=1 Tax=Dongshaea marina TaxID=2047966 RepID=UPI002D790CFC|nr:hypothetical protein [Dongshaea marina]
MSKILMLKTSILGEGSSSNRILEAVGEGDHQITVRDLATVPLPTLDGEIASGLRGPSLCQSISSNLSSSLMS